MPRLEFVSPEGVASADPRPEDLRNLILSEDEDYWSSGAGQATLGVPEPGDGPSLTLTFAPPHGFFVEHRDANGILFVPLVSAVDDGWVTAEVGGDPIRIPLKCVVGRETAWEIVQHFLSLLAVGSFVKWIGMRDLDWDFEANGEDE